MRKLMVYCEMCGSDTLECTTDFIVFHRLSFCSPNCRDDYQAADETRRASAKEQPVAARRPKAA